MKAKKLISFILALCISILALYPCSLAAETALDVATGSAKHEGTAYTCTYDSQEEQILIGGTVSHDLFITHRDYTIKLYKILPERTVDGVLEGEGQTPLASTAMTIKFSFNVDVDSAVDIFSRYVVVLVSNSGSVDYIGDALYPSVESNFAAETEDKSFFKGISTSAVSAAIQSAPSVSVVEVDLGKLLSGGSTGYLYTFEGTNMFFNSAYIDELDKTVRGLSIGGTKVYLQMLLPNGDQDGDGSKARYLMPDVSSEAGMRQIYGYCDFITSRYSSHSSGMISGIIIGKMLDDAERYNKNDTTDVDKYSELLALYGIIVGVATRKNIPSADIVYSFSNANTYGKEANELATYSSSKIIENLCSYFDEFCSEDFDFSVALESSQIPLGISNENLSVGIDIESPINNEYISSENVNIFSEYLKTLESRFFSAPQNVMYIWNVDEDLSGTALSCTYTYLYYDLFFSERISSFVVNTGDDESKAYDLLNTVKYIDTKKGIRNTKQLLQFFSVDSWSELFADFNEDKLAQREHGSFDVLTSLPADKIGDFTYFDFSEKSVLDGWSEGHGCDNLSIDNSTIWGRALKTQFNTESLGGTEYAYLYYSYEYPENLIFTPFVALNLSVESESVSTQKFEIKIALGNKTSVYEYSGITSCGEAAKIYLDVSEFSREYMVEYIRIAVRPISQVSDTFSLYLSSMVGSSVEYDSDELDALISEERLRIRDLSDEGGESSDSGSGTVIIIAMVAVAVILGIMLFVFLRRDETERDEIETDE